MSRRLITPRQTAQRLTLSERQLGRMDEAGIGPKRIQISQARFAYLEDEVEAYIAELAQQRGQVAS
jgi:predicted DNA-binding transcriptional regulator AlpA